MSPNLGTGQVIATSQIVERVHQLAQEQSDYHQKNIQHHNTVENAKRRQKVPENEPQEKVSIHEDGKKGHDQQQQMSQSDREHQNKKEDDPTNPNEKLLKPHIDIVV